MNHTFTFQVTGATAGEVDKHATEEANRFAQGGAFGIISIRSRPFVEAVGGEVELWEADVEAIVPSD